MKRIKRIVCIVSLLIFVGAAFYVMSYTFQELGPTYDGRGTDVTALYADPASYDNSTAKGVADVIVNTNLEKTMAVNNVASVVFDYRGFDTIGESFILLTAIAGSFVILSRTRKPKKTEDGK